MTTAPLQAAAAPRAPARAVLIKIEPPAHRAAPGGHPLREKRLLHEGTNVWWQVQPRNEQGVGAVTRRASRLGNHTDVVLQARRGTPLV